jgi:hypothetical protein
VKRLAESLAEHVSSLSAAAFERLVLARPGLGRQLDSARGDDGAVTVAEVVASLLDGGLVFMAVAGLPLPTLQVLAVLVAESEATPMRPGPGVGRLDPRFLRALSRLDGDAIDMPLRLSLRSGLAACHVDPGEIASGLCGGDARLRATFDRIVESLMDAALIWPEDGRMRLHDEVFSMSDIMAAAEPRTGDRLVADPPELATVRVAGVDLAGAAQAAALGALAESARLFGLVAAEPVPILKAGGVGAREMKRLGKILSLDAERLRFWLHLGEATGLIEVDGGAVLATEAFDEWCAAEPAERYAMLVAGWLDMAAFLSSSQESGGRLSAPLADDAYCGPAPLVRAAVLRGLRAVAEEHAPSAESLLDQVRWRLPVVMGFGRLGESGESDSRICSCGVVHDEEFDALVLDAEATIASVLTEGQLLGAVVSGALASAFRFGPGASNSDSNTHPNTDLDANTNTGTRPGTGIVLFDGWPVAVGSILPATVSTVRIQGDLTAIAGGLPSAPLAALMDSCARRESTGTAVVWRFSDGSVRAFLDAGGDADELLRAVKEHCVGGNLPPALEYLIRDAGRVHGRVDVVSAGSVLVIADAALADEIEVNAALAALGTRRVAPTVLVSPAGPAVALEALRFAGYAPSAHEADGTVSIDIVRGTRRRSGAIGRGTV